MEKKILMILMSGILVLGIAGCGNDTKGSKNPSHNSQVENMSKNEGNESNDKKDETNNNALIVGTYKAKESSINNSITINEDYSCYFLVASPDINYDSSCTYEYDGETITFNLNSGDKIKATFNNDTILWKNYIAGYDLQFYKN